MEIIVYIVCAVITLLLIYFIFPRTRNGNVIPGPKGLPMFGCLFEFSLQTMHTKFMEYAEKHGDIVRINVLGINIVTLNTVDLVQKAFTEVGFKNHFNDRAPTFLGKYIFYGNKGIVLTPDGNGTLHNELRKLFTRSFRIYGDGVKQFEDKVMHEIMTVKLLLQETGSTEFDLMSVFKRLIPFSVGRRQCVGETFARSRIFLYTASLLQQWTFVPSADKVGSCDPRKGDFEINTMMKTRSLFCTLKATETDL